MMPKYLFQKSAQLQMLLPVYSQWITESADEDHNVTSLKYYANKRNC